MDERVLIVIPAYNEEQSIAEVLLSLRRHVPEYDRVVVNDGSTDSTRDLVYELGEKQLNLPCNLGYGLALQTGMKYALVQGYDVVVSLDADGQHRAADVAGMVDALLVNDADMVIGSRFCCGSEYTTPLDRRLGQLLFSHMTRILPGQRIYDTTSGFKAMRRRTCELLVNGAFMDFHIETIVRLSLASYKIIEHPVIVNERVVGQSMHSPASIIRYPLKTLLLIIVSALDVFLARRTR